MDKKKVIGIGVIVLVVLGGAGSIFAMNKSTPNTTPSAKQTLYTKSTTFNSKTYENLLGLSYKVLRNQQILTQDTPKTVFFDILVDKPISDDQVKTLGKEVYRLANTNLQKGIAMGSVNLNVFNNKGAFDKTLQQNYDGGYVHGLTHSLNLTHSSVPELELKSYHVLVSQKSIQKIKTKGTYNIVQVSSSGNHAISADVITNTSGLSDLEDLSQVISTLIRNANPETQQTDLTFYSQPDDYAKKESSADYSTSKPNVLVIHSYGTF
ncbi:hypothetical protein PP175_28330 (plasmid) [Aneurinibacillus sp. Ricciae_BoGa-3]|uniref:hypothetical protein n=1 Tax=Aneurinibacillus sp. Ricciae_BoGa-3 TaxID=3022697 RepID=UPI00233F8958|nr:hypothetical protein [Aneurinibacillus sp. Ricciae_BoGa-3]WCK57099.1 hypothetical protein PP175_28330 [Aneurinibacillus sp. Ricciae_BoGa-3]